LGAAREREPRVLWGESLKNKIGALLRSPSLRAAAMLMAGGFGFAAANILLARVLLPNEFGALSLFLALIQLSLTLGPFGLDLAINRHRLSATAELRRWGGVTSLLTGLGIAVAGRVLYDVEIAMMLCLVVAGIASSFNRFGSSVLQAHQQFGFSLFLGQVHNYILLLAVPVLWLAGSERAVPIAAMISTSYVLTSVIGWRAARRLSTPSQSTPALRNFLKESLAGFGILVATQVLWQLERLVIPSTLTMEDLATFAVVAAIAGSPFRMLQIGIGHTLLPGLRACERREDIHKLLRREGLIAFGASSLSILAVLIVTPFIAEHFLLGRYAIGWGLLAAVIITGLIKVLNGFVSAIVQAFGTTGALAKFNIFTWVGLAIGTMSAIMGARYGIVGVVYGVGVGWLAMSVAALVLATSALRRWKPLHTINAS
jgi:O-antigen/teichoic acid export membrane protein